MANSLTLARIDQLDRIGRQTVVLVPRARPPMQGRYSIGLIPRRSGWTVMFNHAADVHHTPCPSEDQDALRLHWGVMVVSMTSSVP